MLTLVAIHGIVTGGGLLFGWVTQAVGCGSKDNDAQLMGAVFWVLWFLVLSMGALEIEYLSQTALQKKPFKRYLTFKVILHIIDNK